MSDVCCIITDNGSYRPESTFSLRSLAQRLGNRVGHEIHPVSLLHSTKIKSEDLNGIPAEIMEPFLKKKYSEGITKFMVTPMFFGPSAAIKEYLPQRVEALKEGSWPELEVRVAPCVVEPLDFDDKRMAQILVDQIIEVKKRENLSQASVALVDHGAPRARVTDVRNHLGDQVRALLSEAEFPFVKASSMERREGKEYEFNEPLLENLLGSEGFNKDVIVSMIFASPGRHAGPGGDVAEICQEAAKEHDHLNWHMTDLVAEHEGIIDLLEERFKQGLESEPVRWLE